jgi:hypothetical protein
VQKRDANTVAVMSASVALLTLVFRKSIGPKW